MDNLERNVKLERYYPNVIANADEFRQLSVLENDEFKTIWQANCKWFYNTFVYKADLQGIKRWEDMLNLTSKSTETLEDRRINILIKLNSMLPYTIRRLQQILDIRYGENNAIATTTKKYELLIDFNDETELVASSMRAILRCIIPANLIFKIIISCNFEQNIYNKANINQYINSTHDFWNLGTAEKVYWDGVWNFNNIIDFSGIKPDALYRERQTHLLSIKNLLMPVLYININYKIENKQQINSKCKQVISYSNKTENKINNKQKIYKKYQVSNINKNNVIQNRTANTKNCWDGSFCLDGSHILSGAYEIDKQMENICVFYSTKHGIIDEGSKEIL
ncbi:putative phage tail protein [Megamonas funiformis]|uniref:putative phage tail protein n=2 Tax=Megamonas funiformis TaxID=437897 RepID=UPI00204D2FB6|nr:putative phage tail protein [Megamonas funiformis]DAY72230.1 MAG TPA: tail protein [Caudoviricetes sp.]